MAILRCLVEDVALRPDIARERHHQRFAERIDGRIRHLCEKLPEVVEQALGFVRKACRRRVGAHGAHRFFTRCGHRADDHAKIFIGIAECSLALYDILRTEAKCAWRFRQIVEVNLILQNPLPVRLTEGKSCLQFFIGHNSLLCQVCEQHLPWFETSFKHHIGGLDGQDADLGCHDQQILLCHKVAGRPETVPVQCRTNAAAISECHCGWSVPRFHQRSMILIERAFPGIHRGIRVPGLRDEHRQDVRQRAPAK